MADTTQPTDQSVSPPDGFTLDQQQPTSPPDGFVVDNTAVSKDSSTPPDGFTIDQPKAPMGFMDKLVTNIAASGTADEQGHWQPPSFGASLLGAVKGGAESVVSGIKDFDLTDKTPEEAANFTPVKPIAEIAGGLARAAYAPIEGVVTPIAQMTWGKDVGQHIGQDISGLAQVGGGTAEALSEPLPKPESSTFKPTTDPVVSQELQNQGTTPDNADVFQKQQEALANVAMKARNPFDRTADQIDTTIAKNVDVDSDSDLLTSGTRVNPEQFETNIKAPVQDALDAGVPVERVQQELEGGLKASIPDEAHRQEIIDQAIPPRARNIADTTGELSEATGVDKDTVQGITLPNAANDTFAPNVIEQAITQPSDSPQLTAANVKKAFGSNIVSSTLKNWYNNIFNEFDTLSNLNRVWAKQNNINIGRGDAIELSDLPYIQNVSQRSGGNFRSYLGDGQSRSILRIQKGTSELREDGTVQPYLTIKNDAIKAGLDNDTLNKINLARNALDDYTNIEKTAMKSMDAADANNHQLASLREQIKSTQDWNDKYFLQREIDRLNNENDGHFKLIRELGKKQSYMTKEEALAEMAKHEGNPDVKAYTDGLNNLHGALLDDYVTAGKITQEAADRLREAHPNYIPAWREAEDYTFERPVEAYTGGAPKPFMKRDIGKTGRTQINVEDNIVQNIMNAARKNDAAMTKTGVFNNLYHTLNPTDDAWELLFRESKANVANALERLKTGKMDKLFAEDVQPRDPNLLQDYNKVTFDIDGKQLELSVKDKTLWDTLKSSSSGDNSGALKYAQYMARFKRDMLIKYDPTFAVRNFKRATEDFLVNQRGLTMGKDYIPVVSQTKAIANTFFDKDFYDYFTANYGLGNKLNHLYDGKTSEKIIDMVKSNKAPSGLLHGVNVGLGEWNNRVDAGTRILQFKVLRAKLIDQGVPEAKAYEAAMAMAKDVHLNFFQKGSSNNLNAILQTIPLSRTHINAMDKTLRMGINAPLNVAKGLTALYGIHKGIDLWNSQFKDKDGVPFVQKLDPNLKDQNTYVYYGNDVNKAIPWNMGWVWGRAMPALEKTGQYLQQKMGDYFGNTLEQHANSLIGQSNEFAGKITGKELAGAYTDWAFGLLTPSTMLPPLVGTAAGLYLNQDSLGHPIVPSTTQGGPGFSQYYASKTDPALIDLTRTLYTKFGVDISPAKMEYVSRELGGSLTTSAMEAAAHTIAAFQGKEMPQAERSAIPGLGLVTADNSNVPHEGIEMEYGNIYSKLQGVDKQEQALQKQAQEHPEVAAQYSKFITDHTAELHYLSLFKAANTELSQLRKGYEDIISASPDRMQGNQTPEKELLGDPLKREAIDQIRTKMISVQRAVIQKLQDDTNRENFNANDLYNSRLNTSPAGSAVESTFPSLNTKGSSNPTTVKPQSQEEDKPLSFINNAYADTPPAITQQAPDYTPGWFEKSFPTIRTGVVDMNRDDIISKTVGEEGSTYTNTPGDRGGPTKYGITLATLQKSNPRATSDDVKNLTLAKANAVYQNEYWDAGQVSHMPLGVQDLAFDMNVNHGLAGSTHIIQKALNDLGQNVTVDGTMGNTTLNAMNQVNVDRLRQAMINERISYYDQIIRNDPSQAKFKEGWMKRTDDFIPMPDTTA